MYIVTTAFSLSCTAFELLTAAELFQAAMERGMLTSWKIAVASGTPSNIRTFFFIFVGPSEFRRRPHPSACLLASGLTCGRLSTAFPSVSTCSDSSTETRATRFGSLNGLLRAIGTSCGGGLVGRSRANWANTADGGAGGAERGGSSPPKEMLDEVEELVRSNLVIRDVLGLLGCGGLGRERP